MKHIIIFLSFLVFSLLLNNIVDAQMSFGGEPISFSIKLDSEIPVVEMPAFDVNKLLREEEEPTKAKPYRFAKAFQVDLDKNNSGVWDILPDGSKLWRLGLKSEGAYSINIIFDEYFLPQGAKVFLYNIDKTIVLGAFTNRNNKKCKILPVAAIPGDEIIVEYYEPANIDFESKIRIKQVAHDYKSVFSLKKNKDGRFGLSGDCNVDINCPEGDDWQIEKHAVCRIIINGTDLCTATLMNNTNQNATPYMLTANHCISTDFLAEHSVYYFNYESPSCNGPDGTFKTISVSELKATANEVSKDANLDFTLVELSSTPNEDYKPYYAGWNRSETAAENTTSIHHPNGDVKKITIDNDSPINATFMEYNVNSHWKISEWDIGVTEPGSSGCPLFDNNHRVIGDLTGGDASCSYPYNDYYAKFSRSWDDYVAPELSLKSWLDPANTGTITLDGYAPYEINSIEEDNDNNTIYDLTECIFITNIGENDIASLYISEDANHNNNGYISGNNGWGDLAKADYFSSSLFNERTVIDGVFYYFAIAKGGNPQITFAIWDDNSGTVGNQIATATLPLDTIKYYTENEDYSYVDFDPPVVIPGPFYAGVILPTNPGDTIALVSNDENDSDNNTAWEKWSDGEWYAYNDNNSWGLTLSHFIYPVVCKNGSSSKEFAAIQDDFVNVYPNPSSDKVFVNLENTTIKKGNIIVFNSFGKQLVNINFVNNEDIVKLDFSNFSCGLYLIHIISKEGKRIVKKVMITK
ncbi:MAG: T9SS type A sorting domain-containing protein [Bacteroidales bacterium]|nr:T9SS type A sorting domain-containing protein [Bacteroidales bacterium]